VGLILITVVLFALATVNVLTKKVATISGASFTVAFFIVFEFSEKYNRRHTLAHAEDMEKFRLDMKEDVSVEAAKVRPGNVIVAVRNPNRLDHLKRVLDKTDQRRIDIVVLSVRQVTQAGSGEHGLDPGQLFSMDETQVFSKVVALAEKAGKHVELMVVPGGGDPNAAIMQTAQRLQSSRVVMGLSPKMSPAEQGAAVGREWENLPEPRPSLSLEIVTPNEEESLFINLGPHPPRLWPEDLDLLHKLWLELAAKGPGAKLHHRDVVGVALRRMQQELRSGQSEEIIADVTREVSNGSGKPVKKN